MMKRSFLWFFPAVFIFFIFSKPAHAYLNQPFREPGFILSWDTIVAEQDFTLLGPLFNSGIYVDPATVDNFTVIPTLADAVQLGYVIPGGSVDYAFELDAGYVFGGDFVEITGTEEKPPLGDLMIFGVGIYWLLGAESEAPMESMGSMEYVKPLIYYVKHDQGESWAYGMAGGYYMSWTDSNSWGMSFEMSALKFADYWLSNLGFHLYFW